MNSILQPPPETKWNVLNLGAGVQSSCVALMAAHHEIEPMPDFAVFADTQAEPQEVYDWLDWLEGRLPFPVYRVTNGSLTEESLKTHEAESEARYIRRLIPAFGLMPNGEHTMAIGRKCTADFKKKPILKEIRHRCRILRGQKDIAVTQWMGISWDEIQRVKEATDKWTQHRWPLVELRMTRRDCKTWMGVYGYPEPPRSACVYCPFHSDAEWRRIRNDLPKEFKRAVRFEKQWREVCKQDHGLKMEVYLHRSCLPLDQVDFDNDEDKGQQVWDFNAECEGMCGV